MQFMTIIMRIKLGLTFQRIFFFWVVSEKTHIALL